MEVKYWISACETIKVMDPRMVELPSLQSQVTVHPQ